MTGGKSVGKVRYSIVAMLFVATMLNSADRATLSITAPLLAKDLRISPFQLGLVFSAFGWAYVIGQIPGGWLLDRFGSKRVYMISIAAWSLLTALQGGVALLAGGAAIGALFALRFLVGLAEAPALPGNARIVAAWFPSSERGTASAIFNSAQYFATVLFAPIMGYIAHTFGWSHVFIFMGGLGPTEDDLTRECVAAALGRELHRDPQIITELYTRFAAWRRKMPENNEKQADVIEGGVILPNALGSAPGGESGSISAAAATLNTALG